MVRKILLIASICAQASITDQPGCSIMANSADKKAFCYNSANSEMKSLRVDPGQLCQPKYQQAALGAHLAYLQPEQIDTLPQQARDLATIMLNNSSLVHLRPFVSELDNDISDISNALVPEQQAGMITWIEEEGSKPLLQISLRGTDSIADILTDLRAQLTPIRDAFEIDIPGSAHAGILQRAQELLPALNQEVYAMLEEKGLELREISIRFTGHSLGGGLASLLGMLAKQVCPDLDIEVITFNSPRVFDYEAAKHADSIMEADKTIRFWRNRDPVSSIPLGISGFKHIGQSFKLGAIAAHEFRHLVTDERCHSSDLNIESVFGLREDAIETDHIGVLDRLSNLYNKAF